MPEQCKKLPKNLLGGGEANKSQIFPNQSSYETIKNMVIPQDNFLSIILFILYVIDIGEISQNGTITMFGHNALLPQ